MFVQERLHLLLVFFRQETTCCINQTTSWCDTSRGLLQNVGLHLSVLLQSLGVLTPLKIRISTQSSQSTARSVYQYTLCLAMQAANSLVARFLDRKSTRLNSSHVKIS